MTTTHTTLISFPEISLLARDAHKLRGFFGNYFREASPLLHNHLEGGKLKYGYPLVQYKVLNKVPHLLGLNEGAELLRDLFLSMDKIEIEGQTFPVFAKNIRYQKEEIGIVEDLHTYHFETPWMALNEQNHALYLQYSEERQKDQIKGIAIRNLLNVLKDLGYPMSKEMPRVLASFRQTKQMETGFKNNKMLAFLGELTTNVLLPDYIGLGKSVSRGYGVICREKG
ncbi:MAG: CRISPR-associated endonuclease Cas6 [Bacteroidia bacterium]